MASVQTIPKTSITLRGSTEIVSEFFGYSINSILFQRGIYPPETFTRVNKYGLTILVSTDQALSTYLKSVLAQVSQWLMTGDVKKLVVVVASIDTEKTLERWVFDVETDADAVAAGGKKSSEKSEREVMGEIQAIIRQITASVTFLPLLDEPCSFDLLVYTSKDLKEGEDWEQSDPKYIACQQHVNLRSFSTNIHKVDTMVSYAVDETAI
mmetsp:Transcript_7120/g.12784  ORF Transcript_7120/g.12784 Transcript_7120/m.12784 type:complete len:210 (-) Transcript_7120:1971-2600(-)